MRIHYSHTGLRLLCGLFGKTRQAFYDYQNHCRERLLNEAIILDHVHGIRRDFKKMGAIKLHAMLKNELTTTHNIRIGRDRFTQLLRQHQLMVPHPIRYHVKTTDSDHPFFIWPNLIEGWVPQNPHQLWVSDITYLQVNDRFLYLSLITDAYSRKIVGFHLSQSLKATGCITALEKAIAQMPQNATVIHHSDRGVQYCCHDYVRILKDAKIRISMTQTGSPYDNAQAERVNGILKTELGLNETFDSYNKAVKAVARAIDLYNRVRPHLACDLRTPNETHQDKKAPHSGKNQPINPKQLSRQ